MEKKYQNTLSYALLIYMCTIVVFITLIPFEFRIPGEFKITWSTNFADFITNIFLFIPIGFLFRLNRRQSKDILCLNALIFGFLLSSAIEFTQVFIPGRYTQFIDVITNGLGAWLGAILLVLLMGQLRGERTGKLLSLELPLISTIMAAAFTGAVWHRGALFNFNLPVQKHKGTFFHKIIFWGDELVFNSHSAGTH
jgi:glycopeptide antibiotics resistance protein